MKIVSQTSEEMVTTDGGRSVFLPIVFIIFGLGAIYFYLQGANQSIGTLIFGVVFAGLGMLLMLKGSTITVTINKTAGKIYFNKKSMIGGTNADYDIANVQSVELREGSFISNSNNFNNPNQSQGFSVNNGYNNTVLTHQTVLVMKDGTEVPLENIQEKNNSFSVNGMPVGQVLMPGRGTMFATSNQIAQFLGVPFSDVNGTGSPSLNAPQW